MDLARTPPPLHVEPGGMITDFPKIRTSIQEGGLWVLRGGLLIIYPCRMWMAAPRTDQLSFLLNGVVGYGPARALHLHFTQSRAG